MHKRSSRTALVIAVMLAAVQPGRAEVVVFRQGDNGYNGMVDTFLQEDPASAGNNNGAATAVGWDSDDPSGTGFDAYVLMRFDGVFGPAADQVPSGAQITQATLYLTVFNTGDVGTVHRVLAPWSASDNFDTFCGAACTEGIEFGPQEAAAPSAAAVEIAIPVTAALQAWSDGEPHNGWIIRPQADGDNGVDVRSSEYGTLSQRPRLQVRHSEGPPAVALVRRPYLQKATPSAITVVWRTAEPTNSVVRYGPAPDALEQSVIDAAVVTDHIVEITGLQPATTTFYSVGDTLGVHAGGQAEYFFSTPPAVGAQAPLRAWIVGDSGTGDSTQANVRNAMLDVIAGDPPDIFVHLGDIAYDDGTDTEFTVNHFTPYQDILRHTPLWPTIGNHDAHSADSPSESGPYYEAFVLPRAAEAGGLPSGTEAYYSFDHGNAHFICLDSHDTPRQPGSAMLTWLEQDLAATAQDWILAFWHHPPYSKGSHDSDDASDSGGRLRDMRENVLPILEAGGVDVVLCGHSHTYERSYLIDGVYGYGSAPDFATPPLAILQADGHVLDGGDGDPDGAGAYHKPTGTQAGAGAVYVVAGHGGRSTGQEGVHPVMFFTEEANGSCVLDINGDTLTLINIRQDGQVTDTFSIVKACTQDRHCADRVGDGVRDDNCMSWTCQAGACVGQALTFGDMGGSFGDCQPDGTADGHDHFHALACFSNIGADGLAPYPCEADAPVAYSADAGGPFGSCQPDGICDGHDAFHALSAFDHSTTCTCPAPAAPAQQIRPARHAVRLGAE